VFPLFCPILVCRYISCRIFIIVNKWAWWKIEILSPQYCRPKYVFGRGLSNMPVGLTWMQI
jgi:hypothetical protein